MTPSQQAIAFKAGVFELGKQIGLDATTAEGHAAVLGLLVSVTVAFEQGSAAYVPLKMMQCKTDEAIAELRRQYAAISSRN